MTYPQRREGRAGPPHSPLVEPVPPPRLITRTEAALMGYPTMTLAEFEQAEFARYLAGDPDLLPSYSPERIQDPLGCPMQNTHNHAHVGSGEGGFL